MKKNGFSRLDLIFAITILLGLYSCFANTIKEQTTSIETGVDFIGTSVLKEESETAKNLILQEAWQTGEFAVNLTYTSKYNNEITIESLNCESGDIGHEVSIYDPDIETTYSFNTCYLSKSKINFTVVKESLFLTNS